MPPPPPTSKGISTLATRPHWTVSNGQANFAPVPDGWRAVVSPIRQPDSRVRYHVAVVDRTGAARFASETASLPEAVQQAERGVLTRNALRLVRAASGAERVPRPASALRA
jgi:hypothetical protein